MELLTDVLDFLFKTARLVAEFLVFTVIIKYIIGHKIAERIEQKLDEQPEKWGRILAILDHYKNRATGNGHPSNSVLECGQDKCTLFTMSPSAS